MMAEKSEVGKLDKEPIQSVSGSCDLESSQYSESSEEHRASTALGKPASPEPITLESMDFVGSFPEEVKDMILSLLSANDLENCSSVSQLWSSTIKRFQQRQISRLKYNWENGKYSVHYFPMSDEFSYLYVFGIEKLDSNYPYDKCPYFSAYATKDEVGCPIYFSVVHIDAELRKTINHCQYSGFFGRVKEVCVWGGSIVWTSAHESLGALHYYNATLAPDIEMKTIDRWNFCNPNDIWNIICLEMDRNYIAVSNNKQYVKAWCKHTLELKLEQKCRDDASQQISLFDGCLVISNAFEAKPTSVIEIHNLKSDSNNRSTLKHTFTVDGKVQNLHSNKHFVVVNIFLGYESIQVFNKQNYSIIYSYNYDSPSRCSILSAHDDYIVVYEGLKYQSYRILNLATRKWSDISSSTKDLYTVFDNIAVIRNWFDKTLQVFDWKRNTQILTLAIPEQISDKYLFASVTEMRIIIFDIFSNQVVVFKFG